jgi:hypothetical protein
MDDASQKNAYDTASSRAVSAPFGIGAAYVQDRSEPNSRGWYGEVAVDDGKGQKVSVLVGVTPEGGGYPHMAINGQRVAALIEQLAGSLEGDDRVKAIVGATVDGPGILLDRWFPDDYRSIFEERLS